MNSIKITEELAKEYAKLLISIYDQNLDKDSLLNHIQNKTELGISVLEFLDKLGGDKERELEDFLELVFGSKTVEE